MRFTDLPGGPPAVDLRRINDAFTGARLDLSGVIYKCLNCDLYYQSGSFQLLVDRNASRCVGCKVAKLAKVGVVESKARARNLTPEVVTLQEFPKYFDQMVVFEGHVFNVARVGENKDTLGCMFERKPWSKALKMIIFPSGMHKFGGEATVLGYAGATLKIRGLLHTHDRYGPQIILNNPEMILGVWR